MAKDELTDVRKKLIVALSENGMVVSRAASSIGIDNATARYHIKMIKAITGKNPRDFYDLGDLVDMVKPKIHISFLPDGVHELSAHKFVEETKLKNVTVQILKCKECGNVSIGWIRQDNTEEV